MDGDELLGLIGKDLDAAPVQQFLRGLTGRAITTSEEDADRVRHLFLHSGVLVVESPGEARIVALYLQAPGTVGDQGYGGELPSGLLFTHTRNEVIERMHEPDYAGVIGRASFDSWDLEQCMLRVLYDENEKINSIALLPRNPWRKPRSARGARSLSSLAEK
jgi:hypothetical protein